MLRKFLTFFGLLFGNFLFPNATPDLPFDKENEPCFQQDSTAARSILVEDRNKESQHIMMESWRCMNAERLIENIRILSSDKYEGRGPASKGEELTINFIEEQCKDIGLLPANEGSYYQNVPMVGITTDPSVKLFLSNSSQNNQRVLEYGKDFMAWSKHQNAQVNVEGDLVFVGYGIEAPEFNWDDFKGVDVKDKILIMLINDPPVPDPNDPSKLDENTFKGKAMTYYGRWTYKFEMAAAKGAKGCLIVHQTDPARYPWEVVKNSFGGERCYLVSSDGGCSSCPLEGWITYEQAKELFAMAGKDFDTLFAKAVNRDFHPIDLDITMSLTLNNTIRTIQSKNVIAKLPGSDPNLANECIVYSAHWDHLGMGSDKEGRPIYHGAIDNASGVAGLLEIARSFSEIQPPKRSILFLFPTAEEKGLVGSEYYVEHPVMLNTLANINVDGLNLLGPTKNIVALGLLGESFYDKILEDVAKSQNREMIPDPAPENGSFYRGDQLSFAKHGIPAVMLMSGTDFVGKLSGWGEEMLKKFYAEDYHKPSDEIKAYFDPSGAIEDLKFAAEIGYRIANTKEQFTLTSGLEFHKPQ